MHRSRDTSHNTGLTSLENPLISNKKRLVDAEREQGRAMFGFGLRIGFLTPLATSGRAPAVDALPYLDGLIPVSGGNAEAQSSQRDAEGEGGEF